MLKNTLHVAGYADPEKLEESNYACIYKIRDQKQRPFIIKIARSRDDNDLIAREFKVLSHFQHPHIVTVFHFGALVDGRSYFIAEYVPGIPVHEAFTAFSGDFIRAMLQCIQALSAFHTKGFIHCDLKPEHILYDKEEKRTVLIDFGFASAASHEPLPAGTFGYIAPEILKGTGIDQRSDLYSLGVIMYETLAGQKYTTRFDEIKHVPEEIATMIHRLTAEEPALRPIIPEIHKILLKYAQDIDITTPEYAVRLPHLAYIADTRLHGEVKRTRGSTFVIVGTVGTGKSRVLQELKYQCLHDGHSVILHKAKGPLMLHECIAGITGLELPETRIQSDKFQLFENINDALRCHAKNDKVVILIDDLNELSDFEMEFFRYIGHGAPKINIVIIGTTLPDKRISDLGLQQLQIKPFSLKQTRELVRRTFFKIETPAHPIINFTSWLHDQSGGNPLFIVEILKMLYENAILSFTGNRWVVDVMRIGKAKIPKTIAGILRKSMKQLDDKDILVLKVLACAEQALPFAVINMILKEDPDVPAGRLRTLGLIQDEIVGQQRMLYVSNHVLMATVKATITEEERKALCRKILDAMESVNGKRKEHLAIMTNLSCLTGQSDKAVRYAIAAAAWVNALDDRHAAIRFYNIAITHWSKPRDKRYYQLVFDLAETFRLTDNNEAALKWYRKLARSKGSFFRTAAYTGIGKIHSAMNRHKEAVVSYRKALSCRGQRKDHRYGEVAHRLAYSLIMLENFKEARVLLHETSILARKIRDPGMIANTMYYQAVQNLQEQRIDDSIRIAEDCARYLDDKELPRDQAYTANLLSTAYARKGEPRTSAQYLEHAIAYFKQTNVAPALQSALFNKAFNCRNTGQLLEAQQIFQDLLVRSRQTNNQPVIRGCMAELANIFDYLGDLNEALLLHTEQLSMYPDDPAILCAVTTIWCKLGILEKAENSLKRLRRGPENGYFLMAAAHFHLLQRDLKSSRRHIDVLGKLIDHAQVEKPILHDLLFAMIDLSFRIQQFPRTLEYAKRIMPMLSSQSREYMLGSSFQKMSRLYLNHITVLDLTHELDRLKQMGCHYDYARVQHMRIKALLNSAHPSENSDFTGILKETTLICESLQATPELKLAEELTRRTMNKVRGRSSKESPPLNYLDTFANIAEIINSRLGTVDFALHLLNTILQATGAERGALFIKTAAGKMEMAAGRHMDQTTIQDAGEISQTAIMEMDKGQFVFIRDTSSDPHFSTKQSVILNKIHSILCLPLIVSGDVVGALYLDSRKAGGVFSSFDEQFLTAVSKIVASVIEKSNEFGALSDENTILRSTIIDSIGRGYLTGKSKSMKNVYQLVADVAHTDAPVLVIGETGTGKGMLARIIHMKSRRQRQHFQTINCGTISETLLESELFGHKKGSFTGAIHDKPGLLEEAEGGTIFLDEITNTSPAFQAKLLEAIEDKRVRRVGETACRTIDVRFIFATNKDLEIEVEENRFRKDLYYRINVFTILVPPLRERVSDIPILARFFLEKYCKEIGKTIATFSSDAIQSLKKYQWPGNVRELQNTIERAVVIAKGRLITSKQLNISSALDERITSMASIKKEAVIEALDSTKGNISRAARALGISRSSLHRYIKKFHITR